MGICPVGSTFRRADASRLCPSGVCGPAWPVHIRRAGNGGVSRRWAGTLSPDVATLVPTPAITAIYRRCAADQRRRGRGRGRPAGTPVASRPVNQMKTRLQSLGLLDRALRATTDEELDRRRRRPRRRPPRGRRAARGRRRDADAIRAAAAKGRIDGTMESLALVLTDACPGRLHRAARRPRRQPDERPAARGAARPHRAPRRRRHPPDAGLHARRRGGRVGGHPRPPQARRPGQAAPGRGAAPTGPGAPPSRRRRRARDDQGPRARSSSAASRPRPGARREQSARARRRRPEPDDPPASSRSSTQRDGRRSWSSSHAFVSRPPPKPVRLPSAPTTRWHGTTIGSGLRRWRRRPPGPCRRRRAAGPARRSSPSRRTGSCVSAVPRRRAGTPCRRDRAARRTRSRSPAKYSASWRAAVRQHGVAGSSGPSAGARPGRPFGKRTSRSARPTATSVSGPIGRVDDRVRAGRSRCLRSVAGSGAAGAAQRWCRAYERHGRHRSARSASTPRTRQADACTPRSVGRNTSGSPRPRIST